LSGASDKDRGYSDSFNPPHDPRFRDQNPYTGKVQRGSMVRNDPEGRPVARLHFLFNPSQLNISYQVNATDISPDQTTPDQLSVPLMGESPVNLTFELYFDRTYEVNMDPNGPGVFMDTKVFERVAGIFDVDNNSGATGQGGLLYQPVHVYFGSLFAPSFYGTVTSGTVTYTHFSPKMVPMRAIVAVSMSQQFSADIVAEATTGSARGLGPSDARAISDRRTRS
jgi:hypothetical protein